MLFIDPIKLWFSNSDLASSSPSVKQITLYIPKDQYYFQKRKAFDNLKSKSIDEIENSSKKLSEYIRGAAVTGILSPTLKKITAPIEVL